MLSDIFQVTVDQMSRNMNEACDEFLPKVSPKELDRKVGKDFAA